MSITISTVPYDYSSRAVFVAATNQAEDASHVNVRVEASLMVGSTVIAKKTNPKALTTFDFTDILRTFIKFSNPTPFTNPAVVDLIAPIKSGSNLITSWANKTSYNWTNFASSGANITTCNGTPTSTNMMCETNSISFVDGTVYVLLWKNKTLSGTPYIEIGSTGATPLGTYSNYVTTEAGGRCYFLCKSTGSYKLTLGAKVGGGAVSAVGNFELYALSAHDWFKQYSIKFTEKYEDASGVTQTGASADNYKIYSFFKSDLTELEFDTYVNPTGDTVPYLQPDGYFGGYQRSISLKKNIPAGNYSTGYVMGMVKPEIYAAHIDTYLTSEDIYSPIICLNIPATIITTTTVLTLVGNASTDLLEELTVVLNSVAHLEHRELAWVNSYGGTSMFYFGGDNSQLHKVTASYYKDANMINKRYKTIPIEERKVLTLPFADDRTAKYLKDIIDSILVMENTTSLREVMIQDEEMPVYQQGNLFTAEVTYQYGS